jgi:hypothetical protein
MKTYKTQSSHNILHTQKDDIFESAKRCVFAGNMGNSVLIPHVCNNINLFGAGFAHAIAKQYPIVKENFHLLANKAVLGNVQFVSVHKDKTHGHQLIVANMIAQNGVISNNNNRPLNYNALCTCMNTINAFLHKNFDSDNRVQIHTPKFGSGLAGGNWVFIENLIEDIWKDIPVFVYSAPKSTNR